MEDHQHHHSRGTRTGTKTLEGVQQPRGPPICSGCGRHIVDRYMCHLRGELWHAACLVCTDCRMPLQKSCFQSDDKLYCGEHFFRRFGTRCSGCGEGIPPSDLVRRAHNNVYHIACFTCTVCGTLLDTGDQFYLKADNTLICKADYDKVKHTCSTTTDEEDEENSPNTKRPRTSINASQLEGLKNAYNVTRKPSKSMREELGKKYGLDIKVIQVWFQNRRAKEKRLRKEAECAPTQGGLTPDNFPGANVDEAGNKIPGNAFETVSNYLRSWLTSNVWTWSDIGPSSFTVFACVDLEMGTTMACFQSKGKLPLGELREHQGLCIFEESAAQIGNTCFLATKYPQTNINGFSKFDDPLGTEAPAGVAHEKRSIESSGWQSDASSTSACAKDSNLPPNNNSASASEQHHFQQIQPRPTVATSANEDQYQQQFTIQGAVMCATPSGQPPGYTIANGGQAGNYTTYPVSPEMNNGKPREWFM